MKKSILVILTFFIASQSAFGEEKLYRTDHVAVTYEDVSEEYAKAVSRAAEVARQVCRDIFEFDMPETIKIDFRRNFRQKIRLFNDGCDRLYLTVRFEKDLQKPTDSGIFHIYGICHELGHLAMYRIITDHSWLTSSAAEGWAHYIGSRLVDSLYEAEKDNLWPDPYDYSADGMSRLKTQLAKDDVNNTLRAAGLWIDLAQIVSDKQLPTILKAWAQAKIDPSDPGAVLRNVLLETNKDPRLSDWWNRAEPVIVFRRPKSGFSVLAAERKDMTGKPLELAHDDGKQAGKKSIAGAGHAVKFKTEGSGWYLTGVSLYGSRYGHNVAPKENFHVWFCDKDFKVIADFPQPYSIFKKGPPRWVNLPVTPMAVPSEFIVCAGFNPTGTKGVFVGMDSDPTGNSFVGLPGTELKLLDNADWMIRAKLDQTKSGNALTPLE